ncbi:MAG: hypothetical protein M1814_000539 [Vezdaea aestivalis]|nr:MAG: hypothetical protein M1814_000539 [Vezdaea aestivalis]
MSDPSQSLQNDLQIEMEEPQSSVRGLSPMPPNSQDTIRDSYPTPPESRSSWRDSKGTIPLLSRGDSFYDSSPPPSPIPSPELQSPNTPTEYGLLTRSPLVFRSTTKNCPTNPDYTSAIRPLGPPPNTRDSSPEPNNHFKSPETFSERDLDLNKHARYPGRDTDSERTIRAPPPVRQPPLARSPQVPTVHAYQPARYSTVHFSNSMRNMSSAFPPPRTPPPSAPLPSPPSTPMPRFVPYPPKIPTYNCPLKCYPTQPPADRPPSRQPLSSNPPIPSNWSTMERSSFNHLDVDDDSVNRLKFESRRRVKKAMDTIERWATGCFSQG